MYGFDEAMAHRIEDAVTAVEADNTLEIVVRVVPCSGRYSDVAWRWAAVIALAVLSFMLYAPIYVADVWVLPNVVVLGLLGYLVAARFHVFTRLLTRVARREDQAFEHARACFNEHAVSATRERTGVLVYASVLEKLVVVMPDHGAEGAAPRAEWDAINRVGRIGHASMPQRVLDILASIKDLGDRHCPAHEHDNPDELPNAPVIG